MFIMVFLQLLCSCTLYHAKESAADVIIKTTRKYVVIDNDILQLRLTKPGGMIVAVGYRGTDNLLEIMNPKNDRGYWDMHWSEPGFNSTYSRVQGTDFEIVHQDANHVEVSFKTKWDPSLRGKLVPLNIDRRFVVLSGTSGFYTYGIYEHPRDYPAFGLGETRVAIKLRNDKFHYMSLSDRRKRIMPTPEDRSSWRCTQLAYPEAVVLTDPTNPELEGEVDDKYQYSSENKDIRVHGWISSHLQVGFWQIAPSDEFRTGGPLKQDLTSHTGPTTLAMFISNHYSGKELNPQFSEGEYWKKVFGPVLFYLNSNNSRNGPRDLWDDAKYQMQIEMESWPYNFPVSNDFKKSHQRGTIVGRLLVSDRYISKDNMNGSSAFVGLALPGEVGSWQRECKGYQFWTRADGNGSFLIPNVISGVYNMYAWVPGFIGEYMSNTTINVTAGSQMDLGNLVYEPPRDNPTLWEIGIPDRTAMEFFIPDPDPTLVNKLYINFDKFRQYGLWDRYTDLYPRDDLVYTVGVSNYTKDWFYAHVNRKTKNGTLDRTTWRIDFQLGNVQPDETYKLRVALASADNARIQVRFNDLAVNPPHFRLELFGKDNAIARHGIHGLYWLFSIDIESIWLNEGDNSIFLTQNGNDAPFDGLMYDYIRMEGPLMNSARQN